MPGEVKSCPFCGSKAKSVPSRNRVQCTYCRAIIVGSSAIGQERLVAAWNRRAKLAVDLQTATNTGMEAINLAREYQRVCSKNNYMFNMLCEFISWVQEKQHHT